MFNNSSLDELFRFFKFYIISLENKNISHKRFTIDTMYFLHSWNMQEKLPIIQIKHFKSSKEKVKQKCWLKIQNLKQFNNIRELIIRQKRKKKKKVANQDWPCWMERSGLAAMASFFSSLSFFSSFLSSFFLFLSSFLSLLSWNRHEKNF